MWLYSVEMGIGYFAYCETCGRRVTPDDVKRGMAGCIQRRHFCRACLANAGVTAEPEVEARRKATVWLELEVLQAAMAQVPKRVKLA